jgi:hypothetical protein
MIAVICENHTKYKNDSLINTQLFNLKAGGAYNHYPLKVRNMGCKSV